MGESRFFFVHVMKSAGTSFLRYVHENLGSQGPFFRGENSFANRFRGSGIDGSALDFILKNEPEVFRYLPWQGACFFDGHMPFEASRLLASGSSRVNCLTILRHPVERVASHLLQDSGRANTQAKLIQGAKSLYQNPSWWLAYGRDYQVKLFAMTASETLADEKVTSKWLHIMQLLVLAACAPCSSQRRDAAARIISEGDEWNKFEDRGEVPELGFQNFNADFGRIIPQSAPIEVTASRFEVACDRLESCFAIGLTEEIHYMAEEMNRHFNWRPARLKWANQGSGHCLSSAFRKQIARDNEADIEFYQYARRLVAKRYREGVRKYFL